MKTITCTCGSVIETDFKDTYSADEDPGLFEKILEGDFLSVTCGKCGKLLKPEVPVRIIGSSPQADISFFPEKERESVLSGRKTVPEGSHIAVGYPELAEKILTAVSGLDERAVEAVKFYLLGKVEESGDVRIYLHEAGAEKLQFRIHGLREDEIGIVPVARKHYEKILGHIDELEKSDDFQDVLMPPYISVHKVYLGEE